MNSESQSTHQATESSEDQLESNVKDQNHIQVLFQSESPKIVVDFKENENI